MRELLLLRHAKAEAAGNGPDFDRSLASRGRDNARAMGKHLVSLELIPDYAAVSPARRTAETWELTSGAFSNSVAPSFDMRLYGASEATLLAAVRAIPAKFERVILIGHNPGIARLALILAGSGVEEDRTAMQEKFPTCALAVLNFKASSWKRIAPNGGELKAFATPSRLGWK